MSKSVLISGASIAGPITAYWLAKAGWDVTLIERAKELRLGGQNIDITDAAVDIVRMMGLEEAIKARHTGERGLQFVDGNNTAKASFPVSAKGSLTREIEILRGDLAEIFMNAAAPLIKTRFGITIEALDSREDGVGVTFSDGSTQDFDHVIAADGMHSSTRGMILPGEDSVSYLGCWSSYFTIPREADDNDWWRWYTSPTGVIAFLRPDNRGTMRASVNFLSDAADAPHMTVEEKRALLRDRLDGAGWESQRFASALADVDDIYLGPLHQIKAKRWSNGRCAVVGDAAYCPTPYTGMGTTLAVIGSYILAQELASHDDYKEAFKAYDARFRPFAEKSQELPPGVPKAAYAQSRFKAALVNTGAGIAASRPIQALISLFSSDKAKPNAFTLPEYAA
ncbi:MAG: FAD-dependent monooxygenase [Pseudomonadota bacterium]